MRELVPDRGEALEDDTASAGERRVFLCCGYVGLG